MGTTVKTIGTSSRDYSTLQAWEDASPANLVTDGNIWQGQCYNDSEFTVADVAILSISGQTVDATHYVELTAAAGQSFQDAVGVRTNALRYNVTNGVGIRATSGYNSLVSVSTNYTRMNRLQLKHDGTGSNVVSGAGTGAVFKDLVSQTVSGTTIAVSENTQVVNVLGILTGTSGDGIHTNGGCLVLGCTCVRASNQSAAGTGVASGYSTDTLQSTALFGFSTVTSGSFTSSKNNATEQASGLPGTSNQHSVTYNATTPFVQADGTGSLDLRAVAATTLAANGFLDSTNAPNDISATARANPPTIGAWELVTAVSIFGQCKIVSQAVNRANTY